MGGSDPRPTASVQCMATSVGDAQKQLESRPNDVEAQDIEAQDVETQDVEAQGVEAHDVEAQDVEAQDVEAQDVEAHDVEAQDVEAQDVEAQDVEAQDVEAQDVEAQDVEAQDVEAQDVEAQDVEAQDVEAQDVEAQGVEAQDVEAQGVEAEEMRRAILVSTDEVSGETVWNMEIGCMLSGPASAPRGSGPVTVSCVTAKIGKLGEIIGCVLSGAASAPRRSGPVTVSCVTSHSGKLRVLQDSGAKVSFVTAALVSAIDAEHVGVENVEVKPFGAESTQQRMDKFAITILGSSAVIPVCALVKPTLELDLKCASPQTIAQLAEMVSSSNIPPWPPPQQRMTRSGRVVGAPVVFFDL